MFTVTIAGSGSAMPLPGRHPSAQVVTTGDGHVLVDCGEGTQFRLRDLKIARSRLKAVCISHLHGDHYFGLCGLLTSLSMSGRTEKLDLIGPPGLDWILTEIFRQSGTVLAFPLEFIATDDSGIHMVYEAGDLRVETFPLKHGVHSTGFLFRFGGGERNIIRELLPEDITHEEIRQLKAGYDVYDSEGKIRYYSDRLTLPPKAERTYAYCSDTSYLPELAAYLKGVNLLYHEATFLDELREKAELMGHSTAVQAALLARESAAGKLLIGHFSSRYKDTDVLLEEARAIFPDTWYAAEGEVFEV